VEESTQKRCNVTGEEELLREGERTVGSEWRGRRACTLVAKKRVSGPARDSAGRKRTVAAQRSGVNGAAVGRC
jgi:hypothetical protein